MGLAGLAAAAALAVSTTTVRVDPRVELVGVVQRLAEDDVPWRLRAFRAHRGHPAVKGWPRVSEALPMAALLLSPPPELRWERPRELLAPDFVEAAGGWEALEASLEDLRAFARDSRFAERWERLRPWYGRLERRAAAEAARRDLLPELERYVGAPLRTRHTIIVSALCRPRRWNSYIIPYPREGERGPFESYVIARPGRLDENRGQWNEAAYVAVEPATARHAAAVEELRGLSCIAGGRSCFNHLVVSAVLRRLAPETPSEGPEEQRLYERLAEYEAARERYPTLADFYPRLIEALAPRASSSAAP